MTSKALTKAQPQRSKIIIRDIAGGEAHQLVMVKKTATKVLTAAKVACSEAEGTLYSISMKRGKQWVKKYSLTAEGYFLLNGIAGIELRMPPTILVDGREVRNPYRKTNDIGEVVEVVVRCIGVGLSPLGNYLSVDQTVVFSPQEYERAIWLKLLKYQKSAGRIVPSRTYDRMPDEEQDRHHYVPLHRNPRGEVGIILDLDNEDVQRKFSAVAELSQFADRRATTIAMRQVLRKHPAIAKSTVQVDDHGVAHVRVFGWAIPDEREQRELSDLADSLARGEKMETARTLEQVVGSDPITDDDIVATNESDEDGAVDEEESILEVEEESPQDAPQRAGTESGGATAPADPPSDDSGAVPPQDDADPAPPPAEDYEYRQDIIAKIEKRAGKAGAKKRRIAAALKEVGIPTLDECHKHTLEHVLTIVGELYDKDNAPKDPPPPVKVENPDGTTEEFPVGDGTEYKKPEDLGKHTGGSEPDTPPADEPGPRTDGLQDTYRKELTEKGAAVPMMVIKAVMKASQVEQEEGNVSETDSIFYRMNAAIEDCGIDPFAERPLRGLSDEKLADVVAGLAKRLDSVQAMSVLDVTDDLIQAAQQKAGALL